MAVPYNRARFYVNSMEVAADFICQSYVPTGVPPVRKVDTSQGFEPRPTLGQDVLSPARACLRLDGALEGSTLSPAIHRFLLDWARLRNVYGSTRMEGNPISLDDATRVLAEGKASKPNEEEVLRLSRAYARIHEASVLKPLTVDEIARTHGILFDGILAPEDLPGRFKETQNGLRDSPEGPLFFEATPPGRTRAELESLLAWYHGPAQSLDPVVAAGLFFVEFQAIHPFHEGNGRIGRLLNQRLLRAAGYQNVTLTAFDGLVFRRSDKFYASLRATNEGTNHHVWLRFYASTLRDAYEEAHRRGDLRKVIESVGAGCEQDILGWTLGRGIEWFRRRDFPNAKGYADVTLSQSLASLVARGALERRGETRATEYRLNEEFLRRVYAHDLDSLLKA